LKRKRTTNDLADPDGAVALSSAAELFEEEYTNALEHGVLGGGGGGGVLAPPAWFIPAMTLILNPIHARLDAMDARFDAMDARFDAMDARFDAMDARFDAVDARLDAMDAAMVARFQTERAMRRNKAALRTPPAVAAPAGVNLHQVLIGNGESTDCHAVRCWSRPSVP
jgi:hypothetical protein